MTFEEWMAEVNRLAPNANDDLPMAPNETYETVWRAIYEGGFTPIEATAETRIYEYLERRDDEPNFRRKRFRVIGGEQ